MADTVQANYNIPHCTYEQTPEGFKVQFSKPPIPSKGKVAGYQIMAYVLAGMSLFMGISTAMSSGGGAGLGTGIGLFAVGCVIGVFLYNMEVKTIIEVTKDAVIINGMRLSRADFSHFNVDHSLTFGGKQGVVLGYRYGNVSSAYGGLWDEGQGNDFTNALNRHLRRVPMAGDEDRVSPDMLRAARPTDF